MRRRFVVGTDSFTKDQQRSFAEFVKEKKVGWWHYLPDMWLITTLSEELSADVIRDKVMEISPDGAALVLEINEDVDWAAQSKTGDKMYDWLRTTWAKP